MKRFLTLASVLVAALAASAALAAPSAAPTRTPGTLVVGFGDPAVGFAVGTVRGNTIKNPKGYEVDLSKAVAAQLKIPIATVGTRIKRARTKLLKMLMGAPEQDDEE